MNPTAYAPQEVQVRSDAVLLDGFWAAPPEARGTVLFAHGSGSSRFSSRNRYVAQVLHEGGLATLLFDLLTPQEHRVDQVTRQYRFDIELLSQRLIGAVDWVVQEHAISPGAVGLFGASTGAAAALITAAQRPSDVGAVVSRGGRPDLAHQALPSVQAPVLLIVGERDEPVIELNQQAAQELRCPHQLAIVPGATHLFEEFGALERVAKLALDWFLERLAQPRTQ